ncbi:MAG: choice-of-anchor Q domain-containing protein [Planctomycetota bacterium]
MGNNSPAVINCTLTGNSAPVGGAVMVSDDSNLTMTNSIVWGDSAEVGTEIWLGSSSAPSTLSLWCCDVQGGSTEAYIDSGCTLNWDACCIDSDPHFVDSAQGDYHLAIDSPAIDAGNNEPQGDPDVLPVRDLDGNPRIANGIVDIGVYEFGSFDDCNNNGVPDDNEADSDGDGLVDPCDNCPHDANPSQADTDGDGTGDLCDADDDGDGIVDGADNCLVVVNADQADTDNDGVGDLCDNCPLVSNADQDDADGDGVGDICEPVRIYVDVTAKGLNNGTSWQDAYNDLQAALETASGSGGTADEIWVAAGIYRPSRLAIGGIRRGVSFQLISGVAIYGGFAGTEESLDQRNPDPATNGTVLSGDLNGDDLAGAGRWHSTKWDNCYHVVDGSGVGSTAVLDGFTITGGHSISSGGGLQIVNGSPTLSNCRFEGNCAVDGGGLYTSGGNAILHKCTFIGNTADHIGGGMYSDGGHPELSSCVFISNSSDNSGGGLADSGLSTLTNCTFVGNSAAFEGGGLFDTSIVPRMITNCIFWANQVDDRIDGSAQITVIEAEPTVNYCCIQGWSGQWAGVGNIGFNPLFEADGGVHLSAGSPCIDTGDPDFVCGLEARDIDGDGRIQHCRVDMGADESGWFKDCNNNDNADACEVVEGTALDCNRNGLLDWCEVISETRLLVTSEQTDSVIAYDGATGKLWGHFAKPGAAGLDYPSGIAIDSHRNVYVASVLTDSVIQFSGQTGIVIHEFTGGGLGQPMDVLVVEPTILLVSSGRDNSVIEYDLETTEPLGRFIESGSGGLDGPAALLWRPQGNLLVASFHTDQVLEYAGDTGEFIGVTAEGGGLDGPVGLLIDRWGNLLVASHSTNSVLRYGPDGFFLGEFVTSGNGGLDGVGGMAWGPNGNLLVCSVGTSSVLEFSAVDGSPIDRNPFAPGIQAEFARGGGLKSPVDLAFLYKNECNDNGIPDDCDIDNGASSDCNENDIPDECEADSDGDGIINVCDEDDDNDGVFDDGDSSGMEGDNLCKGGATDFCDDNCRLMANPDQADSDADGIGDVCEASRIYVDVKATGSNDGTSWQDAYNGLQDGLDAADESGGALTEIWVASGIYRPSRSSTPGLTRSMSLKLISGVSIYGGFAGTEERFDQRNPDPATNGTILSGDLTVLGRNGSSVEADNCYHVVDGSGTDSTALLAGFTITGGKADGPRRYDCGGGLYNYQGSPTIVNCIFRGNSAKDDGGAIYNTNQSNPTLINCLFVGNWSIQDGGAIYNHTSSPTVINCTFGSNSAKGTGGGIYNHDGSPFLSNCILWGNYDGGGKGASAQMHSQGGGPVLNYCCIGDDVPGDGTVPGGQGNVDTDPLFVRDPDDGGDGWGIGDNDDFGDLRLRIGSPCIDAGNNSLVSLDVMDLDGDGNRFEPIPVDLDLNPRFVDEPTVPDTGKGSLPMVDMGAYEYQPDCNDNGIWDACDVDCGSKGGLCDVLGCGGSGDCNHNGIPDECEPDSDNDGAPDVCEFIYGDFDLDGDVDQEDFGQLQACYGESGGIMELGCGKADLNFDGDVGWSDFKIFRKCITGANIPADSGCTN